MKQSSLLITSALVFCAMGSPFADTYLRIVQPYENANLPAVKQSFVFGSVLPATATLTINGVTVTPYSNGGFLTMIPFQEGKFQIEAVATNGVTVSSVTRTVNVAAPVEAFPEDYGKIEPQSPRTRVVMRSGDTMEVSFQGAPGGAAEFRFSDGGDGVAMEEQVGKTRGLYRGVYTFKPTDTFDESDIVFSLKRKDGKKITAKAGANVTIQRRRTARIVVLKEETTFLTGPDTDYGYNLFGLVGTRLEVTGEWGDFYRVAIGDSNQSWIRKAAANELPAGSVPAKSISRNIRISTTETSTIISIPLQYRHPHRIEQFIDPHNLRLTLFGVVADTDRIRYLSSDSVVKEVTWAQTEPTTCVFEIRTRQQQSWGYDVRYEGDTFILEIRHRPHFVQKGIMMKGLRVAIDAGHSPSSYGTIGPWGNTEASMCLLVARAAKQELERRGVEVILTQDGTKELSLQDRANYAWEKRANIFISIHADACPEGQNPREVEGYSVHYYQPQSRELAELIHRNFGLKTTVRDQGVWRSNFAVCRAPQMISILLEQGFLMLPEFEAMILTPKFQKTIGDVITTSISEFMENNPR